MSDNRHPKEHVGCADCGADASTWSKKRRLPQVGQTYECSECEREVYVYDAGGRGETIKHWRPVSDTMATNLVFYDEVGEWPDQVLEPYYRQGLERMEAIDYYIVEEKDKLTQTRWAERRDVGQFTVSENISKAREKLSG